MILLRNAVRDIDIECYNDLSQLHVGDTVIPMVTSKIFDNVEALQAFDISYYYTFLGLQKQNADTYVTWLVNNKARNHQPRITIKKTKLLITSHYLININSVVLWRCFDD